MDGGGGSGGDELSENSPLSASPLHALESSPSTADLEHTLAGHTALFARHDGPDINMADSDSEQMSDRDAIAALLDDIANISSDEELAEVSDTEMLGDVHRAERGAFQFRQ